MAPVSWTPCNGIDGPTGYGCATVKVPLDYTHPNGTQIGIALDRHAATGSRIGALFVNPGGPGASGVDYLPDIIGILTPAVLARFDIVGFDPRGVGRSDPVTCETGPQLDQFFDLNPDPKTAAGLAQLTAAYRTFDQGCEARSGSVLSFVGTVNAARDLDELRAAVGDAKLSYLGFSYGTLLGATYGGLFPTHIRALALDGAVNPAEPSLPTYVEQSAAINKDLDDFLANCSQDPTCAWKPSGNLRTDYDALMARIAAHPLPGDGTRTLGPGLALDAMFIGLNDEASWPALASGLAAADAGDGSVLLDYGDQYTERNADGTYSNLFEAYYAISCVDSTWPTDPAVIQQAAATARQQAPELGAADVYGIALPCATWPVPATTSPHVITAAGSPPIVVVGSTGDPATPYADAQALAGQLQHGVLLTRVGDGHIGYRSSACIRSHVDSYLIDLTVPPSGIRCPTP